MSTLADKILRDIDLPRESRLLTLYQGDLVIVRGLTLFCETEPFRMREGRDGYRYVEAATLRLDSFEHPCTVALGNALRIDVPLREGDVLAERLVNVCLALSARHPKNHILFYSDADGCPFYEIKQSSLSCEKYTLRFSPCLVSVESS